VRAGSQAGGMRNLCMSNRYECMPDCKADVDAGELDANGQESVQDQLKTAIKEGKADQVGSLLDSNAKVNHAYPPVGLTPLHFAAIFEHLEVAKILKEYGADPTMVTADEEKLTAAQIAATNGNDELTEICSSLIDRHPYRTRLLGPSIIIGVVFVNTCIGFYLFDDSFEWEHGWRDYNGTMPFFGFPWDRSLYSLGVILCLVCLAIANNLDAGTVRPNEVAYVDRLWALPDDEKKDIDEKREQFSYVHTDGSTETFRWCRSCKFWKPRDVSHCSTSRHCYWRFDHYCVAVGNCVAAGNHCMFATMVFSGAFCWFTSAVSILWKIQLQGAFTHTSAWWPVAFGQWPLYLALFFVVEGLLLAGPLLIFATFHVSALFLQYNTKIVWKAGFKPHMFRLNPPEVFFRLFLGASSSESG